MAFLSKYGEARHIYIAIPKAGSANHAVGADWTPAAGDVKISKDGGAAANVTNLPTAIAMGNSALWDFSLTATEMQAGQVMVTIADSATKAVDDTGFIVETYGNSSAQHAFDLDTPLSVDASGRVDLSKVNGSAINNLIAGRVDANTQVIGTGVVDANALAADAANEFADALLDRANGIETGITPRQFMRLVGAALAGELSGAATTTITIKAVNNGATTRIVATVDADGNRSAIVLTP